MSKRAKEEVPNLKTAIMAVEKSLVSGVKIIENWANVVEGTADSTPKVDLSRKYRRSDPPDNVVEFQTGRYHTITRN